MESASQITCAYGWSIVGLIVGREIRSNYYNKLGLGSIKAVVIILFFMDGFVLDLLEGTYLGYSIGSFDGTRVDVGSPFVGLLVVGIMTASEIYAMQLNDSSPIFYKAEMY